MLVASVFVSLQLSTQRNSTRDTKTCVVKPQIVYRNSVWREVVDKFVLGIEQV